MNLRTMLIFFMPDQIKQLFHGKEPQNRDLELLLVVSLSAHKNLSETVRRRWPEILQDTGRRQTLEKVSCPWMDSTSPLEPVESTEAKS